MKYAVIGNGSWGSGFAHHLASIGHDVTVYGRDDQQIEKIRKTNTNPHHLPGVALHPSIKWTSNLNDLEKITTIFLAISAQAIRGFVHDNRHFFREKRVINLSKGIDTKSLKRISEIFKELEDTTYAIISGPSHAEEVALGVPTAVVMASEDQAFVQDIQKNCSSEKFRIYASSDLVGVEFGGALKNILAITIGISDGLGFGDNTKAAIMSRGIKEMIQLSCAYGAKQQTFLGLSGYGDIIVTCTSKHSRNRLWGEYVGKGFELEDASNKVGMVVEGIKTLDAALALAKKKKIEMPLFEALYEIIYDKKNPREAVTELMNRKYKEEDYE